MLDSVYDLVVGGVESECRACGMLGKQGKREGDGEKKKEEKRERNSKKHWFLKSCIILIKP